MPATDYSKTIIYKIVCENECYVGHTTNFINRKYQHKKNCKLINTKLYQFIRNKEWNMIPIEEFPCDNKTQACIREDYWINELKPNLNSQYAVFNKEQIAEYQKEYNKEYRKNNKEEIADKKKLYRVKNSNKIKCECGTVVTKYKLNDHKKTPKHLSLMEAKL